MPEIEIRIGNRVIGKDHPPFVIAELSGNHQQDLDQAKALIRAAAAAGVDAVKLQTYTADTITLNGDNEEFQVSEEGSLWRGENLYSLYQKAHTPWDWHTELFELARSLGLIAFSSPFDESSVDFLESLDVPCYKIASFELNHIPLLKKVAATGKPVIMSTGMATRSEIDEAVATLRQNDCQQLALLKCTSCYPAAIDEANLTTMSDMAQVYQLPVGISDHSQGVGVSLLAAGLGAAIIERHFVLDRSSGAVDAAFSLMPDEMTLLVRESRQLSRALGQVHYGPSDSEKASLKYRRSIYVTKTLAAGATLDKDNIRVVRPGLGLHSRYYEALLGRTLCCGKEANTPLQASDVEGEIEPLTEAGFE